jgi:hypothetical protein
MSEAMDQFDRLHDEERLSRNHLTSFCQPVSFEETSSGESEVKTTWINALKSALVQTMQTAEERKGRYIRMAQVEHSIQQLENKVSSLQVASAVVPIQTFAPEPFDLVREMKVVIQQTDEDEFLATFFDANIGAAGCNQGEAIENLKDMLLSRFDYLEKLPPETLGPGPAKQLAILREFIRRKA